LPAIKASLEVVIINTQVHPPQNIYIKAAMIDSTSVLMAEATVLALGVAITAQLQLQHTNFLSGQELVSFFDTSYHSNPPDWRIKHLTQQFFNYTHQRSTETFKISRSQTQTADTPARQVFREIASSTPTFYYSCSNTAHVYRCTLSVAL
jgi:hypothetical protein